MAELVNFSSLTRDNGAVKKISELMFTTAYKTSELAATCNLLTGQKDGQKLGFIDSIGAIATAGRGCNPTYQAVTPKGYEKAWDMGDYSIPIEICADDWRNTLANYALKVGTPLEDMTNTEIIDGLLMPLIQIAQTQAMWRMAWFGDKNAALIADGGVITAGTNLALLTMCNGLWKRLAAIVAANPAQLTAIAANAETTLALQTSAIRQAGVACGIVEEMLVNADPRIRNNGGKLLMTNSFFQALRLDYNNKYKQTIPFENVSKGVSISEFDGVQIVVNLQWDLDIKTYQNSGTKLNAPHRVVFANPDNLFVGTEDKQTMADLEISYDTTKRVNHIYAASNIDTLVAEDALVQVAM